MSYELVDKLARPTYAIAAYKMFYGSLLDYPGGVGSDQASMELAHGMVATFHRHQLAADASIEFANLLAVSQDGRLDEWFFELDATLFRFFTAALASFESACYSLHALGCMIDSIAFPMAADQQRMDVTSKRTHRRSARAGGPTIPCTRHSPRLSPPTLNAAGYPQTLATAA